MLFSQILEETTATSLAFSSDLFPTFICPSSVILSFLFLFLALHPSLSIYLSSSYLLISTHHFLNRFRFMLHIEFSISPDSVEIILCAFSISLNISHRNVEEEGFQQGKERERGLWINAGGRETIWCVGGSTNHSPCRLQGWEGARGCYKMLGSQSPRSDVEIDPAGTKSVQWGGEGNSCYCCHLGTTKGGINDRTSHDHYC